MSISSRHDESPTRGTRPTDTDLRYKDRTRPGGYALIIAAAVAVGLALLALGSVRMTQSGAVLDQPGITQGALPDGGSEGVLDRNAAPTQEAGAEPSTSVPATAGGLTTDGTTP